MADHMIDADAAGVLIAAIPDRRADRAQFHNPVPDEIVQRAGCDTGLHQRPDLIQDLRRDAARRLHPGKVLRVVNADPFAGLACVVHGVLILY